MNARNDNTGLAAQMSDEWIRNTILKLNDQGGALSGLASILDANLTKITKIVTGIDRITKEVVILKLTNY